MKFDDLFQLNAGIFMHKYINNKLPDSFSNMFKPLSEPNRTNNFLLEKTKHKYLDWFPKVVLPKVWNVLNLELKSAKSANSIKRKFKTDKFYDYKSFRCLKTTCYSCGH